MGRGPFIIVLIADALKGYIPTLVTWYIFQDEGLETAQRYQVAAGIAAVIGHDFPVYIGFRGGRGVATSFGVYAALAMPLAVGLVAVGLFIVLALRYMSVMSLITVPLGALVLFILALVPGGDVYTWTKVIFGGVRDCHRLCDAYSEHPPPDARDGAEDRRGRRATRRKRLRQKAT